MKLKLLFFMSVFCVFYNTMNAQSGDPSVFGNNVWNVYVYNSSDTSFPLANYAGFYTEPILSFDTQARWSQDSSPSTASGYTGIAVGVDNHSYAAKRTGFTAGYYMIDISSHDDSAFLYVNGVEVWNHNACCDSHSDVWHGVLGANSTIEYRVLEQGGGASHGSIKIAPVTINAVVAPFSSSSCQTTVTVTASGGKPPYTGTGVFTVGPGEYEYTVEDSSGGTSSTTVVVKDDSKPIVSTQNIIVNLGADGQVIITPEMVDDGSTDNCGVVSMSLDRTTFSCADIGAASVVEPVAFTNMGTVSQNTHSYGAGYNPNANEFWYPEWSGSTIYKYDTSHNATGTLNAPVSQIIQLWMDKSSSDYYTANWDYYTINRISGSTVVWSYNIGNTPSAVTTSDLYVFAIGSGSNTIVVLNKATGDFVKNITLPSRFYTQGGLVFANDIIYISGFDQDDFSTVPQTWNAIHAFDASTGAYISSVATSIPTYGGVAFDGETIWVSDQGNVIQGYKVSEGNAYENDGVGNKVVLTVTDAAGNTTTGITRVIVKDITAPVITSNGDINVDTDPGVCGAAVVVTATATDNCTVGTPTGVRSDGELLSAVYPIGTTTIRWNVLDTSSNAAVEVVQTVIVTDNQLPLITSNGDKNVNTDLNTCGAVVNYSLPTATDNCSNSVFNDPLVNGSFENDYNGWTILSSVINDVYSAFGILDAGQTISNGGVLYDFNNNQNETMSSPGLPYVGAPTAGNKLAVFLQTGPGNHRMYQDVVLPNNDNLKLNFDLQYNNTMNAFDSNNQFFSVVLRDPTTDIITSVIYKTQQGIDPLILPMTTKTFDITGFKGQTVRLEIISANIQNSFFDILMDNVFISGASNIIEPQQTAGLVSGSTFPVGTTTNTFTATDASGNTSTTSFDVVVTDNQLPVITSNGDKNVNTDLDTCGTVVVVSATATDNCTVVTPTGVRSDGLALDALYPIGITTIAWNVSDANSNDAVEVTQTIVVTDNQLPVLTSNGDKNVTTDLNACGATVVVSASATDNCTVGAPAGVRSDGLELDALYPVGTTTIAWNVLDANSNAAVEVIQTVVVTDNQLPVIVSNGDKNVNTDLDTCGATVVVSATATDNCTVGLPTGVRSDGLVLDALYPVGTTTIAWNVTDANNNNAVAVTQTVVVTDIQKPVAITKNITVQLNAAGNATIVAADVNNGSTDACGIATLALDKTSFTCANVGSNTVTLKVTDNNGNVATQTAIVTVEDKVAPVVVTKNKTIQLNAAGTASIVVADVNNGSTDNCGISLVELDKMAFTCANVGANTVTLKVTDNNGNVASETAIITVEDKIAPVVFTKNITVQLDASSNILIAAADVNNGSTDNCGIRLLELDKALFSCADVGENVVTLKVTDNSGNVATRTAVVTIVNSQPNLIRKHFDDVIFFDNSSKAFIAYSWYKNGVLVSSQTAQYFKDSGVLNGTYYAKATKIDGTVVTTCPLTFSASIVDEYLKIAPNPVKSNASYQILTNVDSAKLQNARITVFTILGALVNDKIVDGTTTDMIAPSTEGIYVVRMTLANGKYFTKNLLVKN